MVVVTHQLVLANGNVWDDTARTFRPGVSILVTDGLISAIGPGVDAAAGAETIDAAGLYILPGLIDCHVHLTSDGGPTALNDSISQPPGITAWQTAKNATATLAAGVTTVRDLGAANRLNIDLAKATASGLVVGPMVLAAGLGVTMTGGHGHGFIAREADGPDEVRKGVREQLRAGATAIKLFASGGVMTPGVDPRSPSFTEEEMRAGVEEAHKAFRVVAAHAQSATGILNAVRAGVDSIEHGVWLEDEAIGLMLERGTFMVPTLTAPHHIAYGGLDAGIPAYMVEKAFQVLEDHKASFRRAVEAGVRVAVGTDQGTPLNRPGENGQEIVRMAENGLSNGAAVLAATAWAADLLRIDAGRLQPGLRADIVLWKADPLADISTLTRRDEISVVIKQGQVIRAGANT